jgi:hypothetical protein
MATPTFILPSAPTYTEGFVNGLNVYPDPTNFIANQVPFTRATTATRTNAAGLIELVPYNLVQYSEQFENVWWGKTRATLTANTIVAPNGLQTADTLEANTTGAGSSVALFGGGFVTVVSGARYTIGVYVKKGNQDWFVLNIGNLANTNYSRQWFNISNGTLGNASIVGAGLNAQSATIEDVGDGWYRCSYSILADDLGFRGGFTLTNANSAFSATIGDTMYLWGAQLVEGTDALPYQQTTTRLNRPRVDFSLGGCPNLLLEPQRTNLVLNSQSFFPSWSTSAQTTATVTTTTTIDPEGLTNAARVQNVTGNQFGRFFIVTSGATYTTSYYIRRVSGTGDINISNLDGGTFLINPTSEWQRFTITSVAGSTTGRCYIRIMTVGDVIEVWGAQLELGAYPTSYIPTSSASVTRNAEVISKTGIADLIGQTEGTLFLDAKYLASATASGRWFNVFGTTNNIGLALNGVNSVRTIINGLSDTITTSPKTDLGIKIAFAYNATGVVLFINGTQYSLPVGGSEVMTSLDSIIFDASNVNFQQGFINSSALWKERLTNDQLEELTGEGFDTYALMASNYNYILQ